MPTYEYECTKCGHLFERFQSMSDEPEKTCPECGGPVKRLIGRGSGIIFKGNGFYSTDYRSKEYKQQAKSDSGSGSSTPATEKSSSESKADSGSSESSSTPASPAPAAPSKPPAKSD